MACVETNGTKRKMVADFTENVKRQKGWRHGDTEDVESSQCGHPDFDTVCKANEEMVDPETGLTDEERDQRSVCVTGIPLRATRKAVDKFFSTVCKVKNIELLVDPGSRVPKAMGYIEFDDPIYVPMATDLSGQLLLGLPIEVKPLSGNLFVGKRSYMQTGRKNFLDKPWRLMTREERIDASTNWRELTDVENKRFFYNIVTEDRRWELPEELAVARNRAHEVAQKRQVQTPEEIVAEFFRLAMCTMDFGLLSSFGPPKG